MNVSDLMTTAVKSCVIGDSLQRAAQLMWENDCGVVPVLDGEGRVVGMTGQVVHRENALEVSIPIEDGHPANTNASHQRFDDIERMFSMTPWTCLAMAPDTGSCQSAWPWVYAAMQMSRSVIMPTTRPSPSSTGTTPQSFSHMSCAAR